MSSGRRRRRDRRLAKRAARELRSPFDLTANLHAYVPRESVERCLRFTVRALRRGRTRIVVNGPAGIGKTLVLHMIGDRVGHELGFVYLPYAALSPEDLCTWALGRMDRAATEHPIEALSECARALGRSDKALLLLLDDAGTMSLSTARWLSQWADDLDGALRLVVAVTDGPQIEPLIEALGAEVERCRLDRPLTLEETQAYVTTRLELAMAPEPVRSRFDAATIETIHRASRGNPRQIHQVASAVLRGAPPESVAPESGPVETEPVQTAAPARVAKKKARSRKKREVVAGGEASAAEVAAGRSLQQTPQAFRCEVDPPALASSSAADALLQPPPKPEPPGLEQSRNVPLEPLTPLRVFRSVTIIAGALVATVMARPNVPLRQPVGEVAAAPRVIAPIATGLPSLPPGIAAPQHTQPRTPRATASATRVGPLSVQVNATPWARIDVDGVDFGATPIADIPLLPGPHTIRARMSDGRTLEKVVEIDESKRFVSFE